MAKRPIFIPNADGTTFVSTIDIMFTWFSGFSEFQRKKSVESLHESAKKLDLFPILEVSTKSNELLGIKLSAFNLLLMKDEMIISVESAFQGSKVFQNGGPYQDLYRLSGREAKKDMRLRQSGNLIGFRFINQEIPVYPKTAFYDWLYISALGQNEQLSPKLSSYMGFSDIEFNPLKSINCQAKSVALYVSLMLRNIRINKKITYTDYIALDLYPSDNHEIHQKISQLNLPL